MNKDKLQLLKTNYVEYKYLCFILLGIMFFTAPFLNYILNLPTISMLFIASSFGIVMYICVTKMCRYGDELRDYIRNSLKENYAVAVETIKNCNYTVKEYNNGCDVIIKSFKVEYVKD